MKLLGKIWRSMGDVERIVRAGGYSLAGLRAALKTEAAFRQLFVLFVVMAPLGLWLGNDAIERVLLVGCLVLVLIVELLNSAIEATVDRIGKQRHKLSGRAKDMGSAAGMLSQLLVVFVWGMILLPRIW
jgi:diacylglycerol kinase (ATP)